MYSTGWSRPTDPPTARRRGFTLLETLLAVAATVLLVLLAGSLILTASRTVSGQQHRQAGRHAAYRALEQIARDLSTALPHARDGTGPFELIPTSPAGDFAQCGFSTAVVPPDETDPTWYTAERVVYRVEERGRDRFALLRLSRPLAGSTTVTTNVLVRNITGFSLELREGSTWRTTWGKDAPESTPAAATVTLGYGPNPGDLLSTEILIPAGHTVPSALERGAQ